MQLTGYEISNEHPSGSGGGQQPENQLGASRRRYPRLVHPLANYQPNDIMGYKIIADQSLEDRLKKCIAFRHDQNSATESFRNAVQSEDHPEHRACMQSLMDNASAAFCMADLAGASIERVIRAWVDSMEKTHPQILG